MWAWKVPTKAPEDGHLKYQEHGNRPILAATWSLTTWDFAYEEGKTILHDITLFAKPGQKLAFVGATGAARPPSRTSSTASTTLPTARSVTTASTSTTSRSPTCGVALGIVLQDTNLFTGTVRENIRYGNLDATDEEVEAAAALANADGFIRRLPDGYDTMLTGDGANLSQGQRQLIAIARAAVADPPVMILGVVVCSGTRIVIRLSSSGLLISISADHRPLTTVPGACRPSAFPDPQTPSGRPPGTPHG